MKKKLVALLFFYVASLQAHVYVSGFAGANWLTAKKNHPFLQAKSGYILSTSLGYALCQDLRMELEYAYRHNSLKPLRWAQYHFKQRYIDTHAFLLNTLWDIPLCLCIKPFIGGGIGYVIQHSKSSFLRMNGDFDSRKNGNESELAWQIIAGVAYPFCRSVDITLEYRFFGTRYKYLYNHSIGLGLKYYFL